MITTINMTFSYSDLNNGILTLASDNVIASTIRVSNPTIAYRPVDMLPLPTAKSGKGCYKSIEFVDEFSGEITIKYDSYNNTRTQLEDGTLESGVGDLPYSKMINKSSVVDDIDRPDISFTNVSDVEPLLARYILLQQFSGKRLVSFYVIARALDDYFDNHWSNVNIDFESGYFDPDIPWLRMNVKAGNRIEVDGDNGLSTVIGGVTSKLYPVDELLNLSYASIMDDMKGLTYSSDVTRVVNKIIAGYTSRTYPTPVLKNGLFTVSDNVLKVRLGGELKELGWNNALSEARKGASETIATIDGILASYEPSSAYKSIQEMVETTLTKGGGSTNYTVDKFEGGTIMIDREVVQLVGRNHSIQVEEAIKAKDRFLIPDTNISYVAEARAVKAIVDSHNTDTLNNKVASSIEDMINYLS